MQRVARRFLIICTTVVVSHAAAGVRAAQQPTFRTGAKTVAVYATVTDKDGRLMPNLERDAFEIRDEGKPRPVTIFSNEVQPITVVLMLDRSGSMRGNVRLVADAADAFVMRLGPGDKARVGSFAEGIEIQPEAFTSDKEALRRVLQPERPVAGPTPLWNAVHAAIVALREQAGRKVVLVFSDGGDAPVSFGRGNHSIGDAVRRAQEDDVMVYAIGLRTTVLGGRSGGGLGGLRSLRPDPGLATIADETGGGYFELTRGEDLGSTFADVADELHHQYALGFEPLRLDDKTHKLEVRVSQRGAKVRARQSYFAKRPVE